MFRLVVPWVAAFLAVAVPLCVEGQEVQPKPKPPYLVNVEEPARWLIRVTQLRPRGGAEPATLAALAAVNPDLDRIEVSKAEGRRLETRVYEGGQRRYLWMEPPGLVFSQPPNSPDPNYVQVTEIGPQAGVLDYKSHDFPEAAWVNETNFRQIIPHEQHGDLMYFEEDIPFNLDSLGQAYSEDELARMKSQFEQDPPKRKAWISFVSKMPVRVQDDSKTYEYVYLPREPFTIRPPAAFNETIARFAPQKR